MRSLRCAFFLALVVPLALLMWADSKLYGPLAGEGKD